MALNGAQKPTPTSQRAAQPMLRPCAKPRPSPSAFSTPRPTAHSAAKWASRIPLCIPLGQEEQQSPPQITEELMDDITSDMEADNGGSAAHELSKSFTEVKHEEVMLKQEERTPNMPASQQRFYNNSGIENGGEGSGEGVKTPAPVFADPQTPATAVPVSGWQLLYEKGEINGAQLPGDAGTADHETHEAAASKGMLDTATTSGALGEPWENDGTLPVDTDGALPFYFVDAHEEHGQPGTVFLFGKVSSVVC